MGLEPITFALQGRCSPNWASDPLYTNLVETSGFEPDWYPHCKWGDHPIAVPIPKSVFWAKLRIWTGHQTTVAAQLCPHSHWPNDLYGPENRLLKYTQGRERSDLFAGQTAIYRFQSAHGLEAMSLAHYFLIMISLWTEGGENPPPSGLFQIAGCSFSELCPQYCYRRVELNHRATVLAVRSNTELLLYKLVRVGSNALPLRSSKDQRLLLSYTRSFIIENDLPLPLKATARVAFNFNPGRLGFNQQRPFSMTTINWWDSNPTCRPCFENYFVREDVSFCTRGWSAIHYTCRPVSLGFPPLRFSQLPY